ncbi:hypothetical protein [Mumia sp. DW29H23]|uniref:hypothetical protein n=1 Tax=Mumia sp. DW29H23 TaxID=3421241 RepID=UPI003D684BB1
MTSHHARLRPDLDHGTWIVTTETGSQYLLDLDAMTIARVPDETRLNQWRQDHPEPVPLEPTTWMQTPGMRRDFEPVPLLQLFLVQVGDAMVMVIDILETGTPTLRATSPVIDIRPGSTPPRAG